MTRKRTEKDNALSAAGQKAEKMLATLLGDMEKDAKAHKDAKDRHYSLTDAMKIIDRVAKFEAIRARVKDDDEGAFFNTPREPDDEGANDETGNTDC